MYPSVITTLPNPSPNDRLNSPSHSSLHSSVNGALSQIETFIGTLPASAVGTLLYDVRSPSSDGGGHVQTAAKGGTGQTTYSKGDLLVAQSSSVLTKLAVSSTLGEVLTSDSSQPLGVKWAGTTGTKININTASIVYRASSIETVIFAASVAGSTLGTNNGARFSIPLTDLDLNNARILAFRAVYGNNTLWTVTLPTTPVNLSSMAGRITGMVVAANSDTIQRSTGEVYISQNPGFERSSVVAITKFQGWGYGTSSINSGITQEFKITAQFTNGQETASGFNVPFGEMDKIT